MNDLVSVIMPAYNSEKYISESIESVMAQDYENWELIIIDDCSTDGTKEIVKEYMKKDERVHLIELKENVGGAISRNHGIRMAEGKYIAFLDSDDLWVRDKLSKHIQFMESNKYNFSYTNYEKISEDTGSAIGIVNSPKSVTYKELLKSNTIGCLTAIYNAKEIGKVYMPPIRKRQDYALWLKILKIEPVAYCLSENLSRYRVRKNSVSTNKIGLLKYNWCVFRKIERMSFFLSSYYLFFNVYKKIFKGTQENRV